MTPVDPQPMDLQSVALQPAGFQANEPQANEPQADEPQADGAPVDDGESSAKAVEETEAIETAEDVSFEPAVGDENAESGEVAAVAPDSVPPSSGPTQRLQQKIKAVAQRTKAKAGKGLKHRPTQLILLGAVATFALGGATSYLLRRPTNGPSSLESAAALVPNSAVASLALNPQSEPWQALRQLGTPNLQRGLGEWLAVGRDRLVNLGYGDLEAIQQQLAGPAVMALVPSAPSASPSAQSGQRPQPSPSDLLLVAPLKNPKAVARSLDERQPPEGFENSTDSHRGIKIWDLQVDLTQRQSVAIFGSFGLLASNRNTLEQAIDSYQAGTALADLNEYEDAQRRLDAADLGSADGALLSFYINGPAAVLSNQTAGRLLPLPAELQGLVSQVRITDGDELTLNTVTWDQTADSLGILGPPPPNLGERPEAMVALGDRFPASTSFLLSGSSVQEAWRSFSQGPASSNSLLSPSTLQEQVQAVTSMDLQQDWLSWMDGPYSVGILPIPTQANSRFQTGLTVMAQTSNRRLAERSLQKLDALMVNKYGLRLSTGELDGQPVVNWSNRNGEAVVTHGWLEGNIAFLIVGAPGANLLLPQPRATLAASRLYREGMPRAATQNPAGVMFVDVDRVLDTQLPSLLPLTPSSRPVLEQLKSIGVERRPLDERFSRYDLSLKLLSRSAAPPVANLEAVTPETQSSEAVPPVSNSSPPTTAPSIEPKEPNEQQSEAPASAEPEAPAKAAKPSEQAPQEEAPLGPIFPETGTEFGPQIPVGLNSASLDGEDETNRDRPLINRSSIDEPGIANPANDEDAFQSENPSPVRSPSAPREDIVVDPLPPVPIGPPTPPSNFDFTPIGPKFPEPEAQQWSDSFTEPVGE